MLREFVSEDYNDARVKVKQSEDTSDLQTDKEMKKRYTIFTDTCIPCTPYSKTLDV
jgi:hypothetical protein